MFKDTHYVDYEHGSLTVRSYSLVKYFFQIFMWLSIYYKSDGGHEDHWRLKIPMDIYGSDGVMFWWCCCVLWAWIRRVRSVHMVAWDNEETQLLQFSSLNQWPWRGITPLMTLWWGINTIKTTWWLSNLIRVYRV